MARRKDPEKNPAHRNASLRLRAGGNAPAPAAWWSPRRWLRLKGRSLRFWIGSAAALAFILWLASSDIVSSAENRMADRFYKSTLGWGLRVEEVYVTGRHHAGADEVLGALDIHRGEPILSVDLQQAHDSLMQIPWIASARIERHLPNVIYVEVVERVPYARWQNQQKTALIDRKGVVLTYDDADTYSSLPLVVGTGANIHAADILDELQGSPDFASTLKAAIRVGDRRWNLRLNNGMTLYLPELGMAEGLQRLENLWRTTDIASRSVKVIDARLPDRVTIDEAPRNDKIDGEAEAPL